tara:strand:- start:96 stop:557 length:462 start_codon:yes stop_codon:yes gene_type:complete
MTEKGLVMGYLQNTVPDMIFEKIDRSQIIELFKNGLSKAILGLIKTIESFDTNMFLNCEIQYHDIIALEESFRKNMNVAIENIYLNMFNPDKKTVSKSLYKELETRNTALQKKYDRLQKKYQTAKDKLNEYEYPNHKYNSNSDDYIVDPADLD